MRKLVVAGVALVLVGLAGLGASLSQATPLAATSVGNGALCTTKACQGGCSCQFHPLMSTQDCAIPRRICACFSFLGADKVPAVGPHVKGDAFEYDGIYPGVNGFREDVEVDLTTLPKESWYIRDSSLIIWPDEGGAIVDLTRPLR